MGRTADPGLTDLVYKDDLTDLNNRRYLRRYLVSKLSSPTSPQLHSLIMLDVDHFKRINDTRGHKCGDQVLIHVANSLRAFFRKSDTIVRYSGDEFIVVLPETNKAMTSSLAERMRKRLLEAPFVYEVGQAPLIVNVSAGVASFPDDAKNVDELLEQADRAMYQSKQTGRARVSIAGDLAAGTLTEVDLMGRFPCPVLVGRDELLQRLARLLPASSKAPAPAPVQFALLKGGAGVGKSRLLAEVRNVSSAAGLTVRMVTCAEEDTLLPYQCMVRVLDDLLSRDPDTVARITATFPDEALYCLKRVMPHIPINKDLSKVTLSAHTQRQVMLKTLSDLVSNLVEIKPMVIVFDELQNVDLGTLTLALSLRNRGQQNISFFGALQPTALEDAVRRQTPLGVFLTIAKGEHFFKVFDVPPLTPEETQKMVSAILPGLPTSPELDALIWTATNGNPLFIQAHLKALISQGQISVHEGAIEVELVAEPEVPRSAEEAVLFNLAVLDKETSELVTDAAVAGPVVEVQLLQALAGINQGHVQDLIVKAQKAAILAETEAEDRLKFSSEAVRQFKYKNTEEERRRKTHGQIGEYIEKTSQDDLQSVMGQLAYHYGKSDQTEKAAEFQAQVKAHAKSVFDPSETTMMAAKKVAQKIPEADEVLSASSAAKVIPFIRAVLDAVAKTKAAPPEENPARALAPTVRATLTRILANDNPLTLAVAGPNVVANGLPITHDPQDLTPETLKQIFLAHNARSLTFQAGVDDREIELLVSAFARRAGVHVGFLWPIWLGENDIKNIYLDQEVKPARIIREGEGAPVSFSAMRSLAPTVLPSSKEPREAPPPSEGVAERIGQPRWAPKAKAAPESPVSRNLLEEFRQLPTARIMHRDVREALLKEFDLAMAEGNREVMQSLMDSVKACLTDASVEVRLHAAGLVEQVLPRCATHECDYLADVLSGVLCEVLVREDDPRVFGRFARITSDEAQRGLKRADYDTVRRIVAALSRPEGPAPNRAVRAQQVSALHELVNSAFFDLLLDDLASGDPARESAATFVLSTFREIIVSKAIRALAISENMRTRLAIVSILKPYARVALDEVKERFRAAAPPNELKRILSVMGELLPESGAVISLGLAHPSDDVAAEAARALFKQPSEMLTTGLAEMLHHDRLAIRMEALHIIGEMKLTSVEETVRECLGSPSEEVAREACVTLGKLGSANSVPELCRILRSRGFLGLFGGVSPSVRAAAAWALGQIGDPKAVPALRKAERERTSAVSAAARLALQPFKAS